MELMLDTADLKKIEQAVDYYPVSGLTTNPSIIKAEGKIDFYEHLRAIRKILGKNRSLHVRESLGKPRQSGARWTARSTSRPLSRAKASRP